MKRSRISMQTIIMIAFATTSVFVILIMSIIFYVQLYRNQIQESANNSSGVINQASNIIEEYLYRMRQISDTAYYTIIKESDAKDVLMQTKIALLYESNRDSLRNIALYLQSGELVLAEPVADEKENANVTDQEWFKNALRKVENMHFSAPHIQNLFYDSTGKLNWVISLSRMVDITMDKHIRRGVLLVDMDYSGLSEIIEHINGVDKDTYYYLCDSDGNIIYHPKQVEISEGLFFENNKAVANYTNGIYEEEFNGQSRGVTVETISYTGWKIVGVINYDPFSRDIGDIKYFVLILIALMIMAMLIVSRILSARISGPILRLDNSVRENEARQKPEIFIGGPAEIRHLGESIQKYYEQIELLMKQFEKEQTERRKSELDALQSQINPHFLYNTLDSIIWMVESEKNDDAVYMISQLARLFRISLSKGQTVISLESELKHAESYMNIQKIRYRESFNVEYKVDDSLKDYCIVKLVLQPILENALSYGIEGIDDGKIEIGAYKEEEDLYVYVRDNGIGMTSKETESVLLRTGHVKKKGSGVGLVNVNNRLKILFGEEYGLIIESEPDEGTTVTIHIPAIVCSEENRIHLEGNHEA